VQGEQPGNAAEDPRFFDGRFLFEIVSWDWHYHLGLSTEAMPREYRFQGGLMYGNSFDLECRVVAPAQYRGRRVRTWIMTLGKEVIFSEADEPEDVGNLYFRGPHQPSEELRATLLMPEDATATMATCLASVSKYIHVWTFDPDDNEASVSSYSFSADIHPNIRSWAEG
jgi:hypothetical protein